MNSLLRFGINIKNYAKFVTNVYLYVGEIGVLTLKEMGDEVFKIIFCLKVVSSIYEK